MSEKMTIVSDVNLFMIENMSKFELLCFPTHMIEHMNKVFVQKKKRYGMLRRY